MKKGNLEIKEDMDDSFVFRANNYSVYRIGNMQDLKDLRSLIDTVLKEERKIGGHTYSKSGKDMCCQPLTEGEYGKPDFIGKDNLGALKQVHKYMSEGEGEDLEVEEECKHPNSTRVCNNCRIDWSKVEDKPVQKLPSERIGEIVKQFKTDGAPTDDAILVAIIQYLDEQSKK